MKINQIIDNLISYERGYWTQDPTQPLGHDTGRDKVLYGEAHLNDECTGIVTTCWATADVIEKAHKMGANLIIAHEALFWNHGDQQDWLKESKNKTYLAKTKLLDEYKIVVRRDHDHLHSGIPKPGQPDTWVDGIFYGFVKEIGWEKYLKTNLGIPLYIDLPHPMTAREIGSLLINKLNLNGCRIEGDPNTRCQKLMIPQHNLGDAKDYIKTIDKKGIDCLLAMEMIDFTLAEYIRDSSILGQNRCLVQIGHFNTEEAGMKYMINWLPTAIKTDKIPMKYIQSGDMYHYIAES